MTKMINRAIIIVLDSFGVGETPDAKEYGDVGSNTLEGIYNNTKMELPNMKKLGLYNIQGLKIHCTYVVENTVLADMLDNKKYKPISLE